jgi:hypothetical protein
MGILHKNVRTVMIMSRSVHLKIRKLFRINTVEDIKTHILCSMHFFFGKHACYDVMWKGMVDPDRSQVTI